MPTASPERSLQDRSSLDASFSINRKIQSLETLPSEVIQQIFIHCLDLALPAASLPLCRQLTDLQHLKKSLFLHAFYPSLVSPLTVLSLPRSLNEQSHHCVQVQSQLFRLRWFTHPFVTATLSDMKTRMPYRLRTHKDVSMPSKVLHGPRDDDKLALVNLLLPSRASMEEPENSAIVSASLLSASSMNNVRLLKALVRRQYRYNTTCSPDEEPEADSAAYHEIGFMNIFITGDHEADAPHLDPNTGERFGSSPRWYEGIQPETEHLRAAIIEGGAQGKTLEVLWRCGDHTMDMCDDDIWDWLRDKGTENVSWLAEQLKSWNKKHPPNKQCCCGECNADDERRVPGLKDSNKPCGRLKKKSVECPVCQTINERLARLERRSVDHRRRNTLRRKTAQNR